MTDPSPEDIDLIEQVLADHYKAAGTAWRDNVGWPPAPRNGFWKCACGATGDVHQHRRATSLHRRHQGREVLRALASRLR